MNRRPWLLVGLSVRPLAVAAAAAGHSVCAIDAFADRDTLAACAGRAQKLALTRRWRIGAAALARALCEARRRFAPGGFAGVVAGSGFEAEPDLLDLLAEAAPLYGSAAAAVRAVREARRWFALLDRIAAPYPAVAYTPPALRRGWLLKSSGGSGGWHVQPWQGEALPAPDGYFQRRAAGRPASALFVADGQRARVIGWQWQILAPTDGLPWRYGGVMTAHDLEPALRRRVVALLDAIVAEAGLRGLGGLDFLVEGDELQLLELNPRPTASVALYGPGHAGGDLFALHLAACRGSLPAADAVDGHAGATVGEAVLYASAPLAVPGAYPWPDWCRDVPSGAAQFAMGQPVCTVQGSAASPAALRAGLSRRMQSLSIHLLENCLDEPPPRERQCARRPPRPLAAR